MNFWLDIVFRRRLFPECNAVKNMFLLTKSKVYVQYVQIK